MTNNTERFNGLIDNNDLVSNNPALFEQLVDVFLSTYNTDSGYSLDMQVADFLEDRELYSPINYNRLKTTVEYFV